jgi:membrane fusion protein (multidrug efflux system)
MKVRLKKLAILSNYYVFLVIIILALGMTIPIRWTVTAYGIAEPVKKYMVKPPVEGVISEVLVQAGETVAPDQPIVRLRDPQIKVSKASNQAEYEKAKLYLEYCKKMRTKGYISENELKEAELNYFVYSTKLAETKNYDVISPASGTLLTTDEFSLRIGDRIEAGTIIATVADLSRMQMKIRMPEHNISRIQVGNEVRVYMNAFPSMLYKTIPGRISVIQPQAVVDQNGSNIIVIVSLDENFLKYGKRRYSLMPGMAGHAKIVYERSSFFEHVIRKSFDTFSKHI